MLSTDRPDSSFAGAYLGNGYLGQRLGVAGAGVTGAAAEPAFLAGLYEREALVQLPPVVPLALRSNDRWFGADLTQLRGYHQEVRLREGLLATRATWDTGAGSADVAIETALLRQQPDLALVTVKVTNHGSTAVSIGVPEGLLSSGTFEGGRFHTAVGGATLDGRVQALDPSANLTPTAGLAAGYDVPSGQTAELALVARVSGGPVKLKNALSRLPELTPQDVTALLEAHKKAWAQLWTSDIQIDGNPEAQQVVRTCLFHLLCSTRPESDAGIPPMGLSSNAFQGHVFWDMDSWMLPALLPQQPDLARGMLEYRYRTLAGARANAKAEGLPGASYAWESASTGKETVGGIFQHGRHVTGDAALALKQYYQATGDRAWLQSRAWPILKETADNWVARAKPGPGGTLVIQQVTTPDELAGQVDQSAWTQYVARQNLEFAAEAARALGQPANPRWEQVAKGLTFLRDPKTKLILPYAGFTDRSKAKQADVLLLVHPGELELPADELGRMYDYYAPRVIANGPAMTDAIHAIVAARLGRTDDALARFRASYEPFVRQPYLLFSEKRSRDNLCFHTGEAGVIEAVIYGFAGLHLHSTGDRPHLEPHLPPSWTALRIRRLRWRGKTWNVELKPGISPVWTPAG